MNLYGREVGVWVPETDSEPGASCLTFRPEDCKPAYCKLEVTDINGLKTHEVVSGGWYDDSCVQLVEGKQFLNMSNAMQRMKDSLATTTSGPAAQFDFIEVITTLVGSGPHTELNTNFLTGHKVNGRQ